jgi:hypothetical protein
MISQATERHRESLTEVEALNDRDLLTLYDHLLGMMTGPRTIRLRENPSLFAAIRVYRSQKAFARALYHTKKLLQLPQ